MNLPDVVQKFRADITGYQSGLSSMIMSLESFAGTAKNKGQLAFSGIKDAIAETKTQINAFNIALREVDANRATNRVTALRKELESLGKTLAGLKGQYADAMRISTDLGPLRTRRDHRSSAFGDPVSSRIREDMERAASERRTFGIAPAAAQRQLAANVAAGNRQRLQSARQAQQASQQAQTQLAANVAAGNRQRLQQAKAAQRAQNAAQRKAAQIAQKRAGVRRGRRQRTVASIGGLGRGLLGGLNPFNTASIPGFIMGVTGAAAALHLMKEAAHAVRNSIDTIVTSAMEMERVTVTLGVLLGSAEKGKETFAAIQKMAIVTPFTTEQLSNAAQTLLGMGVAGEQLIPVLDRIGDLAVGDADRLRRLSIIFGQVTAEGRLTGQRMRQFATLGIGIEDFAATMGVSANTARAQMRSFGIDTNVVVETINRLTEAGGRFAGLNAANLQTVSGQWARLVDVVQISAGKMGLEIFQKFDIAGTIGAISDQISEAMPTITKIVLSAMEAISAVLREISNIGVAAFQTLGQYLGSLKSGAGGVNSSLMDIRSTVQTVTDGFLEFGKIGIRVLAEIAKLALHVVVAIAEVVGSMGALVNIAKGAGIGALAGAGYGLAGGPIGIAGGAAIGAGVGWLTSPSGSGTNSGVNGLVSVVDKVVDSLGKMGDVFDENMRKIRIEPGGLFPGHQAIPEIRGILQRAQTAMGKGFDKDTIFKAAGMELNLMRLPADRLKLALDAVSKELDEMGKASFRAKIALGSHVSPEAARKQEEISKELREGTNPLEKFRYGMKLIDEFANPERNRQEYIKEQSKTAIEASKIVGAFGSLATSNLEAKKKEWESQFPSAESQLGDLESFRANRMKGLKDAHYEKQKTAAFPREFMEKDIPKDFNQTTERDWNKDLVALREWNKERMRGKTSPFVGGVVATGVQEVGKFMSGFLENTVPWLISKVAGEGELTPEQQRERDFGRFKTYEELRQATGIGNPADNLPTTALYGSVEAQKTINQTQTELQLDKLSEINVTLAIAKEIAERQNANIEKTNTILDQIAQRAPALIPKALKR